MQKSSLTFLQSSKPTKHDQLDLFGFDNDTALLSFVPKKYKSVLLVSTMHQDDKIDDQTGKPDIIWHYNQTMGAVDTVDQMSHTYSVQRKTKSWPLAYFMNVLNLGGLNFYITYITIFFGP